MTVGDIFIRLLNVSVTAGYLAVAVIFLRLLLKKTPKWINCVLWGLVALRLILPFSLKSALSVIPSKEIIPSYTVDSAVPVINSGIAPIDEIVNPVFGSAFAAAPTGSVNPLRLTVDIAGMVWLAGLAAMLIYSVISMLKIKKQVGASVRRADGVYVCDEVRSPFILGVIRPRIYLPSDMDVATEELIISHEKAHITRGDHIWKPLGFLLLSVYWFNPLMWIAYILLCRDIELACDEKVIKKLEKDGIADYSEALLRFSAPRKLITACPVAFGEVGVKDRVKSVLNYKKPAFWIIIVAVAACVVTAVCLLTDPIEEYKVPWDQFCINVAGKEIEMSPENKAYIADLLNKGQWKSEVRAYIGADITFFFEKQTVYYFRMDGTFYDTVKKKYLTVSDHDREKIDEILGTDAVVVPIIIVGQNSDTAKAKVSITESNITSERISFTVQWTNVSDEPFELTAEYCLYVSENGSYRKLEPRPDSLTFPAILYSIPKTGTQTVTYDLSAFDLAFGETYRLFLNGTDHGDYWIDFINLNTGHNRHSPIDSGCWFEYGDTKVVSAKGLYWCQIDTVDEFGMNQCIMADGGGLSQDLYISTDPPTIYYSTKKNDKIRYFEYGKETEKKFTLWNANKMYKVIYDGDDVYGYLKKHPGTYFITVECYRTKRENGRTEKGVYTEGVRITVTD